MVYNFYHITDVHYYSKKNFACDYTKLPQPSTQICILKSEESFKKALSIVENDPDTNTVIITGDLTNHGDSNSHNEVRELLREFTLKGGAPYVVTDTHDYPYFDVYTIDENGEKVPDTPMSRENVVPTYYPYGRDKGFDIFDGDDTTYIAEILPGLFYIAFGYDLTSADGYNDPNFSDELMNWAKKHICVINQKGGTVICGTHWPIVSPSPAYSVVGKGNTFLNGEKFAKELADLGVRLFFSGHTHIQCIKKITSDKGNDLYSVQTSSLPGFPPKMRKITIDTDKKIFDIKTIDMELDGLGDISFADYTRRGFLGIIEGIPYNMEHDVEAFANTEGGISLPKDLILKHPKAVMFLGRKLNGLTYGKVAKFSRKYHGMTESDYAAVKERRFVDLLFDLVANLYRGNASYSPDSVEYKITLGTIKKIEKLLSVLHIDIKKPLYGYTLSEFVDPLLCNKGPDDDNLTVNFN